MLFRSLTRHKPACKYGNVSANPCIKGGCIGCSVQQRECQRTGIATPRICSSRALEANLSVLILLAYAFIRLQLHNLIIDKAISATGRQR
jgi:hypothetical protein